MIEAGTARVEVVGLTSAPGETPADGQSAQYSPATTTTTAPDSAEPVLPYEVPTPILSAAAASAGAADPAAASQAAQTPVQPLTPASSQSTGDYLQVGAVSSIDAAQRLGVQLHELVQEMGGEMVGELARETAIFITQLPIDSLYRVRLGPFQTLDSAARVSERIQSQLQLVPVTVPR